MRKPHYAFLAATILTGGLAWWAVSSGTLGQLFSSNPPVSFPVTQSARQDRTQTNKELALKELNETIIPKVDFKNDTLEECLDFIRLRHRELGMGKGVSILVRSSTQPTSEDGLGGDISGDNEASDPAQKRITYKGSNLTTAQLLDIICKQANMRWEMSDYGVVFQPNKSEKNLVTEKTST